jgi:hypothetical protein
MGIHVFFSPGVGTFSHGVGDYFSFSSGVDDNAPVLVRSWLLVLAWKHHWQPARSLSTQCIGASPCPHPEKLQKSIWSNFTYSPVTFFWQICWLVPSQYLSRQHQ